MVKVSKDLNCVQFILNKSSIFFKSRGWVMTIANYTKSPTMDNRLFLDMWFWLYSIEIIEITIVAQQLKRDHIIVDHSLERHTSVFVSMLFY